jgi:hypothetical protein
VPGEPGRLGDVVLLVAEPAEAQNVLSAAALWSTIH